MPAVARDAGTDTVFSPHGDKKQCKAPSIQSTDQGVSKVYIESHLAINIGKTMRIHNMPGCIPHAPSLDSGSSKVFCEGQPIARIGDTYGGEHPITSGSSKVFAA
jgi:uncharacterized Zn-binding protein involved in type VI secretion